MLGGTTPRSALTPVNALVDLVFLGDLCLQFFLGYFDDRLRMWNFDHRSICARYVRGWFCADLLSIFPFDEVLSALGGAGARQVPFHLAQFLKLVRLASPRMQDRILMLLPVQISNQYKSLIKFVCALCLLIHLSACG